MEDLTDVDTEVLKREKRARQETIDELEELQANIQKKIESRRRRTSAITEELADRDELDFSSDLPNVGGMYPREVIATLEAEFDHGVPAEVAKNGLAIAGHDPGTLEELREEGEIYLISKNGNDVYRTT